MTTGVAVFEMSEDYLYWVKYCFFSFFFPCHFTLILGVNQLWATHVKSDQTASHTGVIVLSSPPAPPPKKKKNLRMQLLAGASFTNEVAVIHKHRKESWSPKQLSPPTRRSAVALSLLFPVGRYRVIGWWTLSISCVPPSVQPCDIMVSLPTFLLLGMTFWRLLSLCSKTCHFERKC